MSASRLSESVRRQLRAARWQWRALRATVRATAHDLRDPGPWFDADHYRSQWPGLAACSRAALLQHYRCAGWLAAASPHPLFDLQHYRDQCRQAGLVAAGDPLAHFLRVGLQRGLSPCPLLPAAALLQLAPAGADATPASLVALHPWGPLAQAIAAGEPALQLLSRWQAAGALPDEVLAALPSLPAELFPDPPDSLPATPSSSGPWVARIVGHSWQSWQAHALLQHVPLPLEPARVTWLDGQTPAEGDAGARAGVFVLHLQPLAISNAAGLLPALSGGPVFDPDAAQVRLLRRLGVNAHPIDPSGPVQNQLLRHPEDVAMAARCLGLPAPAALTPGRTATAPALLCLGSAGADWERSLKAPIWAWPGFDSVQIHGANEARLLASWLDHANRSGLQLIRLGASDSERRLGAWQALCPPSDPHPHWLPPQFFQPPLTGEELLHELPWRRAGCPPPAPVTTPRPQATALWHSGERGSAAAAAVCISLYNYADCIEAALASVAAQSEPELELIVVDDHSSDDGPQRCQRWLERHGGRFRRALLLRHDHNAGLAAARNTAFQAARAAWCFVLDADNTLAPEAVACCLAIAQQAPSSTAVVHPLVEVVSSPDRRDELARAERALISGLSWQRQAFLQGNVLDAMALIRRQAWQQVGGYSHIPGGWEDFDFWCKLIEAGWHGVLCPQRLALYNAHGSSMLATQTHRRLRAVSRLLQARHPWLDLPLAKLN